MCQKGLQIKVRLLQGGVRPREQGAANHSLGRQTLSTPNLTKRKPFAVDGLQCDRTVLYTEDFILLHLIANSFPIFQELERICKKLNQIHQELRTFCRTFEKFTL